MKKEMVARELVRIIPMFLRNVGPELRCLEPSLSPSHFRVLHTLKIRSYHLGELAEKQGVTQATMSNTVSMLAERGWVQRTVCEDDRRKVFVQITADGETLLYSMVQLLQERIGEHLSDLSDAELEQVHHGLVILQRALHANGDRTPCALEHELLSISSERANTQMEN